MVVQHDEQIATVFRALGHPTRVWLVRRLSQDERCVCELVAESGIDQPVLSQHLQVLKRAGILDSCRDGNRIIYALSAPGFAAMLDMVAR
jgi:ArsR family transcriptional regulator